MTYEETVDLVNNLYATTGAGDFDLAETMLTDDFFITEADTLPMAGVYKGRTALRELYSKVMGMMDVASLKIEAITAGGDYAVVVLSFQFVDPKLAPAHLCEMFLFRDGKACEIRPYYFDPKPIIEACRAKAAQ